MDLTVRPLVADDAEAARRLGFEAFGVPQGPPAEPARIDQPGRVSFGAFLGEELVAKTVDRAFDSYFGGASLPTSGIAGVTVAAEARGQGAFAPLLTETLRAAKERGAVISGLFPSAPQIYRRFGYEVVTDLDTVEVPTQVLGSVARPAGGIEVRRAGADDFDAVRAVYDTWAVGQNGPLSRRGVSFPVTASEFLDGFTGVTLACDDGGAVVGFMSWERGRDYGDRAVIAVSDLLAISGEAYRALLATVGSFSSVTGLTSLRTSGLDPVRFLLPSRHWSRVETLPYMIKVLDVAGAVGGRRYPPGLTTRLTFRLAGDALAENNAGYAVSIADGRAECAVDDGAGPEGRILTPRGLALLYAGAQSCANLRMAGHLTGGDVAADLDFDAAFGGRQPHIRDFY